MSLSYSNSSVIHGPITGSVIAQIEARRTLLENKQNREDSDLLYLNSKTGWIRASSGVNELVDDKDEKGNSRLASENVLAGGTINKDILRGGIFNTTNSSYDFSDQYGYRPMAGITGFNVDVVGTYGSLRKATISFKANSKEQLDTLEKLYLRPGFSILVEWGHTLSLDNDGEVSTIVEHIDEIFDLSSDTAVYERGEEIKNKSGHNYDYMFGRITNFIWSYNVDTTYDCSIDIVGYGEMVESIKAVLSPSTSTDKVTAEQNINNLKNQATALHKFLNIIQNSGTNRIVQGPVEDKGLYTSEIKALEELIPDLYGRIVDSLSKVNRSVQVETVLGKVDSGELAVIKYIPMYLLLELINEIFTLKSDNTGKLEPIFKFYIGNKEDLNKTPFLTFKQHLCVDPTIAVLPKPGVPASTTSLFSYKFAENINPPGSTDDILNIYVSIGTIIEAFDQVISSPNPSEQTVYKALRTILTNLQDSLGNINNFDIHLEEGGKLAYIVDRKVTPNDRDLKDSIFDLAGLGAFTKNISIQSKLSNDISSVIAISAAASSNDAGEEILGLQKFNSGIADRYITKRQISKEVADNKKILERLQNAKNIQLLLDFLDNANSPKNSKNDIYYTLSLNKDEIRGVKSVHRLIMKEFVEYYVIKLSESPPGLIPVELSFTLDGISGLKIGNAFTIKDGILPSRYEGEVGFIIKKLSHKVQNNQWETEVGALMTIISRSPVELSNTIPQTEDDIINNLTGVYDAINAPLLDYRKIIKSPDMQVRNDTSGGGTYRARRPGRFHRGTDFVAQPGTPVFSPIEGTIEFRANFSKNLPFVVINGTGTYEGFTFRLGYVTVDKLTLAQGVVFPGGLVGTVVNMKGPDGYNDPNMINHVHVDATYNSLKIDPERINYT